MRMSCNGCRVLRKGCSEDCSIKPCLQWIKSAESQANATVFLAKFYGRAGLMNLINAGPEHLRPAIFRSLLHEACGRIVNPIYGSVGLLWSGSWQLCQAAVEAVLKGAPITPITSEVATNGQGPPLKSYDIRHVSKSENSDASRKQLKTRSRFKRSGSGVIKPMPSKGTGVVPVEQGQEFANRSASHESSLSHLSGTHESKESESVVSVETSILFHDEPESDARVAGRTEESADEIGLELTLGFEPASRVHHVVPVKKRRIELKDCGASSENGLCKVELGLEYSA